MRRFTKLLLLVLLLVLFTTAGSGNATALAVNIAAGVIAIVTPFIPLAQIHLKDQGIFIVSMVLALLIAVVAAYLNGDIKPSDLQGSLITLAEKFGLIWTVQQAVFQLFKDHTKVGPLLTTKPLLVAPAPATP